MNERFREAFKLTKLSKEKLALQLDVSTKTIRRLEKGETPSIGLDMLKALHEKFGINLNWLISGSETYESDVSVNDSKKSNNDSLTTNEQLETLRQFVKHLEKENSWLREKYDEVLNRQKNEEGKQEQGRSFG